jgi:hypothetical protein
MESTCLLRILGEWWKISFINERMSLSRLNENNATSYLRCHSAVSKPPRHCPYLKELDNPRVIGEDIKKRRLQLRVPQEYVVKYLMFEKIQLSVGRIAGAFLTHFYPTIIQSLGYNPFPVDVLTLGWRMKQYRIETG